MIIIKKVFSFQSSLTTSLFFRRISSGDICAFVECSIPGNKMCLCLSLKEQERKTLLMTDVKEIHFLTEEEQQQQQHYTIYLLTNY